MTAVTWNPSDKATHVVLSGGNLIATPTNGWPNEAVRATLGRSTGKYYFEAKVANASAGSGASVGLANSGRSLTAGDIGSVGGDTLAWGSWVGKISSNAEGQMRHAGSNGNSWTDGAFSTGPIIGIAVDLDAGKMWLACNNTWMNSGDPAGGTNPEYTGLSGTLYPIVSNDGTAADFFTGYFKAAALNYSPPSGFSAWDDTVDNVGASAGTSLASATGASIRSAVGSAAGTSTASAFSPPGTGLAAGTSTAAAVGYAFAPIGAAAGTSTVSAVGHTGYTATAVGTADATSEVLVVHTPVPLVSTANATSTVGARREVTAVSTANATSTISGKKTADVTAVDTADATSAISFDRVVTAVSTANATSAISFVRDMPLVSTANATSIAVVKRIVTGVAVSTADATSTVRGSDAFTAVSTANATSASPSVRRVTVECVSTANATSAAGSTNHTEVECVSTANATSAISGQWHANITLVSTANATSYVRLPSGALASLYTNTHTMAPATWGGLPFNSMVEVDGVVYGAGVDGLYRLDSEADDNGEEVAADVTWDLLDFGSATRKRPDTFYFAGSAAGPMNVRVTNTQGAFDYTTKLRRSEEDVNYRATLGRGLHSRYLRIGMQNPRGVTFDVTDPKVTFRDTTKRS